MVRVQVAIAVQPIEKIGNVCQICSSKTAVLQAAVFGRNQFESKEGNLTGSTHFGYLLLQVTGVQGHLFKRGRRQINIPINKWGWEIMVFGLFAGGCGAGGQ